ncbi:MAG: glycosyltransferase [Planctomycetota bacterium]|nr:MAG: glycosyltransferase [Planctomycetota bacterium]
MSQEEKKEEQQIEEQEKAADTPEEKEGAILKKFATFSSLSIVIPIFNEEENLPILWDRLEKVVENLKEYSLEVEVIFIDDGSRDSSLEILKSFTQKAPWVKVLELARNFGQHPAIFAGFAKAQGDVVVTLDGDLQNPPEEIPKLLAKIDEGYDVVGGWRKERKDSAFRRYASRLINRFTARMTGVDLHDYGCMLRAYRKNIVDKMLGCPEISSFIPALATLFTKRVCEIHVEHSERFKGESKYSFWKLINLQFDLVTSFSSFPLKLTTYFGAFLALLGVGFGIFLLIMRIIKGVEWAAYGIFTLFAILFVFVGMQFVSIGIMGEYIGRIYSEVRRRPRYVIRMIHSQDGSSLQKEESSNENDLSEKSNPQSISSDS